MSPPDEEKVSASLLDHWFPNLFILSIAIIATAAWHLRPVGYFIAMQEDGLLEWATFWTFMAAGLVFLFEARPRFETSFKEAWFTAALGLFAIVVALEEISWGQRLIGFLPGEYFLTNNHQIEANVHNLIDPLLMHWIFSALLIAYGVVVPITARMSDLGPLTKQLGLHAPRIGQTPAFALTAIMALFWPVSFSNEVVELMFAICLLVAATDIRRHRVHFWWIMGLALVLAIGTRTALSLTPADQQARTDEAKAELQALGDDIRSIPGPLPATGGFDVRLYSFVSKGNLTFLKRSGFQDLMRRKDAVPERARFFLDPWNQAYWIADVYDGNRRRLVLYSLGADRIADRSAGAARGDDIIEIAYEETVPPT